MWRGPRFEFQPRSSRSPGPSSTAPASAQKKASGPERRGRTHMTHPGFRHVLSYGCPCGSRPSAAPATPRLALPTSSSGTWRYRIAPVLPVTAFPCTTRPERPDRYRGILRWRHDSVQQPPSNVQRESRNVELRHVYEPAVTRTVLGKASKLPQLSRRGSEVRGDLVLLLCSGKIAGLALHDQLMGLDEANETRTSDRRSPPENSCPSPVTHLFNSSGRMF